MTRNNKNKKTKRKDRKDNKDTKNSKSTKLTKSASGKCQHLRDLIGKAKNKVARGHALQKYMKCRRGN